MQILELLKTEFSVELLTLNASGKIAADGILIFFHYFSEKIKPDISCELSATVLSTSFRKSFFAWRFTQTK